MLKATANPTASTLLNTISFQDRTSLPKVGCVGSSYTQQQTTLSSVTLSETRSWMKWWHIFSNIILPGEISSLSKKSDSAYIVAICNTGLTTTIWAKSGNGN